MTRKRTNPQNLRKVTSHTISVTVSDSKKTKLKNSSKVTGESHASKGLKQNRTLTFNNDSVKLAALSVIIAGMSFIYTMQTDLATDTPLKQTYKLTLYCIILELSLCVMADIVVMHLNKRIFKGVWGGVLIFLSFLMAFMTGIRLYYIYGKSFVYKTTFAIILALWFVVGAYIANSTTIIDTNNPEKLGNSIWWAACIFMLGLLTCIGCLCFIGPCFQ